MNGLNLVLSDQATDDITVLGLHVADESLIEADEFIDFIHAHCEELCANPELGHNRSKDRDGLRWFQAKPYLIHYRHTPETVEIIRILNSFQANEASLTDK